MDLAAVDDPTSNDVLPSYEDANNDNNHGPKSRFTLSRIIRRAQTGEAVKTNESPHTLMKVLLYKFINKNFFIFLVPSRDGNVQISEKFARRDG